MVPVVKNFCCDGSGHEYEETEDEETEEEEGDEGRRERGEESEEEEIDIEKEIEELSPLLGAAREGLESCLQILLEKGGDVNVAMTVFSLSLSFS